MSPITEIESFFCKINWIISPFRELVFIMIFRNLIPNLVSMFNKLNELNWFSVDEVPTPSHAGRYIVFILTLINRDNVSNLETFLNLRYLIQQKVAKYNKMSAMCTYNYYKSIKNILTACIIFTEKMSCDGFLGTVIN